MKIKTVALLIIVHLTISGFAQKNEESVLIGMGTSFDFGGLIGPSDMTEMAFLSINPIMMFKINNKLLIGIETSIHIVQENRVKGRVLPLIRYKFKDQSNYTFIQCYPVGLSFIKHQSTNFSYGLKIGRSYKVEKRIQFEVLCGIEGVNYGKKIFQNGEAYLTLGINLLINPK